MVVILLVISEGLRPLNSLSVYATERAIYRLLLIFRLHVAKILFSYLLKSFQKYFLRVLNAIVILLIVEAFKLTRIISTNAITRFHLTPYIFY